MEIPAVSVIIPMYNVEKYIGELLDSLFAQTFRDFEIIIVDDCSTDNSTAIVKNYAEKFDGRLTLTKTQKNSGNPGEPSNIGIYLSRGEYLLILDNDDAITPTALEELYPIAKNFNADVIACEKYYRVPAKFWHDAEFRRQIKPLNEQYSDCVAKPTLIPFDVAERVKVCRQRKILWNVWSKLIRRNFLIENGIRFNPDMIQDMLFSCCLFYAAERYIRVPNAINFFRIRDDSLSHKNYSGEEAFIKYVRALVTGFKFLNNFLSKRTFFLEHPQVKYFALETYFNEISIYLGKIYEANPTYIFDDILQQEFGRDNNSALMAFTFSMENIYKIMWRNAQVKISELQRHIAELENKR